MHNATTLVNIIKQENPQAIKTVIENRKSVNEKTLDLLYTLPIEGIEITKDDMGMATWFYISRNGKTVASQFFWNEGEYDAEGNHSMFDEYGFSIK